MKRVATFGFLIALFCSSVWAEVYTIDFNRGSVSGTKIKTKLEDKTPFETICSSGASYFIASNVANSYYDYNGCGLRIGQENKTGQAYVLFTFNPELQGKLIKSIIVYASRGTDNMEANISILATGISSTIYFTDMKPYDSSYPESSNYMLPGVASIPKLQIKGANTDYIILHRIDIVVSDNAGDDDAIHSPAESVDEMGVFCNLAGQRTSRPSRGIYIKGGKKYVVR